jgi:HD-like signal output (HDOD) protein/CheY-like chemotaxis protein
MNILLVDDESRVLAALERVLFADGPPEWVIQTATSGDDALRLLAGEPFDVVVSDMRMPGMNGVDLLTAVQARWPSMVRIILSGQSDADASLRSVGVAHQFLDKPCDSRHLIATLERIAQVRHVVGNDRVGAVLGRLGTLPPAPSIFLELSRLLDDDSASIERIAALVRRDPALVANLLKLVNSSFFCRGSATHDVQAAVLRLGLQVVRAAALGSFAAATSEDARRDAERDRFHAFHVGLLAEMIAPAKVREIAFVSGILHDIGDGALRRSEPELMAEARRHSTRHRAPMVDAERAIVGVTHAEMGAYLLTLWGLPTPVAEAVAHHHGPFGAPVSPAAAALHVGEALLHGHDVDPACLAALGEAAVRPEWQERATALRAS